MATLDMQQLAAFAGSLQDEAREVLRARFRSGLGIEVKADRSPVTEADREVERFLRERVLESYPEHGWRGEELGAEREQAEWVWVADPIDGTRSFASGRPLFTSLLALLHWGEPVMGLIEAPMLGERWVGLLDRATTLNGREVRVRAPRPLAEATVVVSRPGSFHGELAGALERLQSACNWLFFENDAYGCGQLARGDVDLIVEADLKAEDIAALVPVVRGAGGVLQQWDGSEPYSPGGASIVAATCEPLAREAMGIMGQVSIPVGHGTGR